MRLLRPTRTTLALSVCLLTMACTLSYQHYRLTHLTTAIAETAGKESPDAFQTKLEQFDERFAAVDQKYLTSNEDFRTGQRALSNRLDTLEGAANQVRERVEHLDLGSASAEDLVLVRASVENVAAELKALQLRYSTANAKPPSPASSTQKAASRAKTRKSAPPPPFDVIGLEHRGGQEFLAIAPIGSNQLSQIQLVRPGDGVSGTSWRLRSVDSASASFDVAGVSQTIALAR